VWKNKCDHKGKYWNFILKIPYNEDGYPMTESDYFKKGTGLNEKTFVDYMYYRKCCFINGRLQNQGRGTGGREIEGSELIECY
jgi:hypothetical protein